MIELLSDLVAFIRHGKRYWLLPIFVALLLVGGLIVAGEGSAVMPFIYALF